jgi:anti-anti-sigma regulatory factor
MRSDKLLTFSIKRDRDVAIILLQDPEPPIKPAPKAVDVNAIVSWMNGETLQDDVTPVFWEQFRDELLSVLENERPRKLIVDFSGTSSFISSAMNSVMVHARNVSLAWNCEWRLCMDENQRRSYEISGYLDKLFPFVHESRREAVSAFVRPDV